jgi:hypothetical protein
MSKSPTGDFEWEKGANDQRPSSCIILRASPALLCEVKAQADTCPRAGFCKSRHEAERLAGEQQ